MPKTTKKNRKKNLSSKPLVQYVKNRLGHRFTLSGGKLFHVHNYGGNATLTQSIRLRDLRNTLTTGGAYLDGQQVERMDGTVENFPATWEVDRTGSGDDLQLSIGCQTFHGNNAAKILKRARVTV
jgi:hypothetical protein